MASVELIGTFAALRGSVSKKSGLSYRTNRNGKVFTCAKPGATIEMILGQEPYVPPKRELSPAQIAVQERFKRIQEWKKKILTSPELKQEYYKRYCEYRKTPKHKMTNFQGYLVKIGYQEVEK